MVKRILVGDDDLDVHELLHDILHINFRRVDVERALSGETFVKKIAETQYDLILLNKRMQYNGQDMVSSIRITNPDVMNHVILLTDSSSESCDTLSQKIPCISKPFSLDYFGQIIKEVCSS